MKQRETAYTGPFPSFLLQQVTEGPCPWCSMLLPQAGFPGDPQLEISVWWQYCNIKQLGSICESILLSLGFDLNSRLDTEDDVMKENNL